MLNGTGRIADLAHELKSHVDFYEFIEEPMPALWRYCPNCYELADSNSLLKRCPRCPGVPNNLLKVLPLDPEAAQAALRIGGQPALIQMILSLVGEEFCDMYCEQGGPPIEDPEL